jgi:hypothetical protein
MARGGCKTPPPPTCSPIVTRSHSNDNIVPQTTTTSNDNPWITVEPVTPNPPGDDIQEIVRQSLIRTHSVLARIRQPSWPLNKPLDFFDIREKLEGTDLTLNPTNPDHILNPAAGGSSIPPSPPLHLLNLLEKNHQTKVVLHPSLRHLPHIWKIQTILPDLGSTKMQWPYLVPSILCLNIQRNGSLNLTQTPSRSLKITSKGLC